MRKFTHWIVSKTIKDHERTDDLKVRARYGALEGWVSVVINLLLFVIKGALGLTTKSISLIADAIHTLSDTATSIIVIIGFRIAKKPSDKEHPFGHGRMEAVATLIVAVLLILAGVEFLEASIRRLINPTPVNASWLVLGIIVATIIIKELLARFKELGVMIDSKTLEADFLHHRSDVYATALVVVALLSSRFGYTRIDGVAGILVSFIIIYSGYVIAKEAVSPLLGEAPSRELLRKIEKTARNFEGVYGVHDVIVHQYGRETLASLHIEVSGGENPTKLHDLSEAVEQKVGEEIHGAVVVHVDPLNKDHERYEEIASAVGKMVSEDDRISSYHDLRIVGCDRKVCNVVFDIVLAEGVDEQEEYDVKKLLREKLEASLPEMGIVIKSEPRFSYSGKA
jgi:cation diffusion facilitator family transporter